MATFRIDAIGATPARLRSWLDRARKATSDRPAAARLGLLALLAGTLAVAGCLAAWSVAPADRVPLASGRSFRKVDLEKIERAFQSRGLDYAIDGRRVIVPSRSADVAAEVVAKLDLGPRTPDELREGSAPSSWLFESSRERDERLQRDRAKVFESIIDGLPGVESSFVSLPVRERSRPSAKLAAKPTCLVQVRTESGAELSPGTVESIISILAAASPGLTRESFWIGDGEGRIYRDPAQPDLAAQSSNRAREEELTRRIMDKLSWIKGVLVLVQLEDAPSEAEPLPPPAPRREPGVSVGLNRAMEVDADEPAPRIDDLVPALVATSEPTRKRGGAWVFVPRSHYYDVSRHPGGGQPSHEDYIANKNKTEQVIQTTVRLASTEGDVDWAPTIVDVLPDEMPAEGPSPAAAAGSRRSAREWAVAGGAGAAAAALVALGTWVLGRQPTRKAAPRRGETRYHRGSPGTPAPTERVLEFVRRNPEAAFSVLNRWTVQGGGKS
ncbi:hypothetical protein [Paludisphaera sp.]|uniref:hypothetical protein n=1 Tax=Paludisphaera sp. TaxID=2017432 RepID=UPI00301DFF0F